jgi:hypothetical protein
MVQLDMGIQLMGLVEPSIISGTHPEKLRNMVAIFRQYPDPGSTTIFQRQTPATLCTDLFNFLEFPPIKSISVPWSVLVNIVLESPHTTQAKGDVPLGHDNVNAFAWRYIVDQIRTVRDSLVLD